MKVHQKASFLLFLLGAIEIDPFLTLANSFGSCFVHIPTAIAPSTPPALLLPHPHDNSPIVLLIPSRRIVSFSSRYDDENTSIEDLDPKEDAVSKARRLLAQAKQLREQAEKEEEKIHFDLTRKKEAKDQETDELIQELLLESSSLDPKFKFKFKIGNPVSPNIAARRIQAKRPSTLCLLRIIDRLQAQEAEAAGESHIVAMTFDSHTKDRVNKSQPQQHQQQQQQPPFFFQRAFSSEAIHPENVKKIQQIRKVLLDAALFLDQQQKEERGKQSFPFHSPIMMEREQWMSGTLYPTLLDRVHFVQREQEESFKRRQEEFFQAAKRKKHFDEAGGEGFSGGRSIYQKQAPEENGKNDTKNKKDPSLKP